MTVPQARAEFHESLGIDGLDYPRRLINVGRLTVGQSIRGQLLIGPAAKDKASTLQSVAVDADLGIERDGLARRDGQPAPREGTGRRVEGSHDLADLSVARLLAGGDRPDGVVGGRPALLVRHVGRKLQAKGNVGEAIVLVDVAKLRPVAE